MQFQEDLFETQIFDLHLGIPASLQFAEHRFRGVRNRDQCVTTADFAPQGIANRERLWQVVTRGDTQPLDAVFQIIERAVVDELAVFDEDDPVGNAFNV